VDTSQRISQAVSLVPIVVSIIILFVGSVGSWFVVQEDFFPHAISDETIFLDSGSDYNYHLDGVVITNEAGESKIAYSAATVLCDGGEPTCMVYQMRGIVFYNIGLVFYAAFSLSIISSVLIFLRDYNLIQKINKQFKTDVTREDLLAASFGAHVSVIVFALFLLFYAIIGIPSAMHEDHTGGFKECLYTNDITVVGKNDGCDVWIEGEGVELNSLWAIGPAFIIFLAGSLFSSIYLTSYTYNQLTDISEDSVPEPELFFDSDSKLLFDVNTGEVIKSFVKDKRPLFFDTEAKVLFDEDTGDIVYSAYFDKFISKKVKSGKEDKEPEKEDKEPEKEDKEPEKEDKEPEKEDKEPEKEDKEPVKKDKKPKKEKN